MKRFLIDTSIILCAVIFSISAIVYYNITPSDKADCNDLTAVCDEENIPQLTKCYYSTLVAYDKQFKGHFSSTSLESEFALNTYYGDTTYVVCFKDGRILTQLRTRTAEPVINEEIVYTTERIK